jgi:hypothetical protein
MIDLHMHRVFMGNLQIARARPCFVMKHAEALCGLNASFAGKEVTFVKQHFA